MIGPGADLLTVSGNNQSKIFSILETPVVSISGMTLTNGNGVGASPGNTFGGAVYNQGVLTLTNMVITGNSATSDGGGVYNSTSDSMTIIGCTITNNTAASQSGGVHNHSSATMTITDSTISNNAVTTGTGSGNGGGGIYSEDSSTLSLTNTTISGNTATSSGGGILADSVTFTMTNSTISGNSATGVGGGIAFDVDSPTTITRSTISGNTATTDGGGIHTQPDTNTLMSIANSTISGNMAVNGGGIFRVANSSLTVTLSHTTVANNSATTSGGGISGTLVLSNTLAGNNNAPTGPDYAGTLSSQDHNLVENTTGATITGTTANNITGQDPNLGSLSNNGGLTFTHALLAGSPAIDKGASGALTVDQRQLTRPYDDPSIPNAAGGNGSDIGSYEDQPGVFTPVGTGVNVVDPIGNPSVTFSQVTAGGSTTFTPIDPASAGTLPAGYTLVGGNTAFDITTTAIVTPPIDVCLNVAAITDLQAFERVRILHGEGGVLVDRTILAPDTPAPNFATKTVCARVNSLSPFVAAFAPAQSFATISGRVTTPTGLGLRNAVVSLVDAENNRRTATTSSFGGYTFENVPVAPGYTMTASSKRYRFAPRLLDVSGNANNIDFVGLE